MLKAFLQTHTLTGGAFSLIPSLLCSIVCIFSSSPATLPPPPHYSILAVLQGSAAKLHNTAEYSVYACWADARTYCQSSIFLSLRLVLHNLSHTPTSWHSSLVPPSSLLGSLPWQGGQTSCDSAVVCRIHSAQGPQALDDNQPNLSHRFSTAWNIHRTICQKWPAAAFPQTTSLNATQSLLQKSRQSSPLYYLSFSTMVFCSFTRTCSSFCMLITGTQSNEEGNVRHISDSSLWCCERRLTWCKQERMKERELSLHEVIDWMLNRIKFLVSVLEEEWCAFALLEHAHWTYF